MTNKCSVLITVLACTCIWADPCAFSILYAENSPRVANLAIDNKPQEKLRVKSSRELNKFGTGIYLLGPDLLYGGWLNYYLTPSFGVEIGGTYVPLGRNSLSLLHVGGRYYFSGSHKGARWSPYIGLFATKSLNSNIDPSFDIYLPFGMELVAYNGFTFGAELALDLLITGFFHLPWGGIRFGYQF